jgi:hypothetical protein
MTAVKNESKRPKKRVLTLEQKQKNAARNRKSRQEILVKKRIIAARERKTFKQKSRRAIARAQKTHFSDDRALAASSLLLLVAVDSDVEETNTQPEEAVNYVKPISDLWSDDRNAIEKALTDLYDYAGVDEILRLGGHMAIVQVLKKKLEDDLIQEKGIQALYIFTDSTPGKLLVGDIGGVDAILAGMKQHPEAINVQTWGCDAIANLLKNTKPNAARFAESDGITQVIAAMKAHPDDAHVQWHGCLALFYLSEWAEYRPLIFAAGGAVTIATVMEKYSDHPRGVREGSHDGVQNLLREASQNAMQKLMERD